MQIIDNNTLASITILIAESNPKEKEIMIDLIMNFLKQNLKISQISLKNIDIKVNLRYN